MVHTIIHIDIFNIKIEKGNFMLTDREKEILDKLRKTLPYLTEEQLDQLTWIAIGMDLSNQSNANKEAKEREKE